MESRSSLSASPTYQHQQHNTLCREHYYEENAEKTNMVILCIGSNRVVIPTLDSNVKALKTMTAKIINK